MARRALGVVLSLFVLATPAAALEVQVKDVRAPALAVETAIELRDLVPERFTRVIDNGGVLHVRVQAEMWESRPVWDRLVYPAIVRMFRLARGTSNRDVSLTDQEGRTVLVGARDVPVTLEVGDRGRVDAASRYYLRVVATVGTIAQREVDDAGDAVFGRPSESNGLGSLGRLVFRTALQVGDYLQSVSAETKSRRILGRDIVGP
jgi:hypothetical protein